MTIRQISAREGKALLHSGGEIAFLDLREAGPYSEGHPLFATHCPFSLLEARICVLVPRLAVPLLLIDSGDGVAAVGADILAQMGYRDISVIDGGASAWAAAGYTLYQGVNVPSKTLGELIEHLWQPGIIKPQTLADWQTEGREFAFFDCRPASEYAKMTVPGALCLPNGELAHRLATIDANGPLVLTCAGRTRGVIGAAGLSMVNPKREILALENGTQGWRLAGLSLSFENTPGRLPTLGDKAAEETRRRAREFMSEKNIQYVDADAIGGMVADPDRSTFLIDVRSEEEAARDPLAGFAHALSGQLVQATDQWIGVRRARVVLADDLGLRASLAAFWLRILGFETYVAEVSDELRAIPCAPRQYRPKAGTETCSADTALNATLGGQGVFLDARTSQAFCKGHVKGATWVNRSALSHLPVGPKYLLIDDGGVRAALVVTELKRLGHHQVFLIEGGHRALLQAKAEMDTGSSMSLAKAVDVTSFAHGRHEGNLEASRLYLDWEMGLVAQLDGDERAEFQL